MLHEPTGLDSLTERQRQLLRAYIVEGSYKGAAHRIHRSYGHVRNEAGTILRQLDVGSITQACIAFDRSER